LQADLPSTPGDRNRRADAAPQRGFTLVEVIISLLLVGIVGSFSLFFLATGVEGYFISQRAADAAFKAQVALNRVRLEILDLDTLEAAPVADTSIQYRSSNGQLSGMRMLRFSAGTFYLRIDGTDYPLIDQIASPVIDVQYDDLDNDPLNDEVAYIDIGFSIDSQPEYRVRVYPRNMVDQF
jgi:prepilin-type N-terminal cleavage/methylation domain-containing protein